MARNEKVLDEVITPPLWTKEFIVITFSNLFLFLSFHMLIPTLPMYVAHLGGNAFSIGMVLSLFTISALLTRPFVGKALDMISRRKILITGLLILTICNLIFPLISTVLFVLLVRLLHGIGWGISTTSYVTIVADVVPSQRRGEGLGYFGLASNLSMALSPIFGIWLMNNLGFGWLFTIATSLGIVGIILSQLIKYRELPELNDETKNKAEVKLKKAPFYKGLFETRSLFPAMLMLFVATTYGGIMGFITLFGEETGINNIGLFFLSFAGSLMVIRPIAGKLFDVKGHPVVLLPGVLFIILGLFSLSITSTYTALIIAGILYGAGFGAIQPSLLAWAINRAPANRRGAANGTFASSVDLGIGLGAFIMGLIANVTSYAEMYRISIIMAIVFLIVYGIFLLKEKNSEVEEGMKGDC